MAFVGQNVVLKQHEPSAPLEIGELQPPTDECFYSLDIDVCAPTHWDIIPSKQSIWPRVPGGAFIGRDDQHELLGCAGYVPCGICHSCRSGLALACTHPTRPGINAPGAFGNRIVLSRSPLVPQIPEDCDFASLVALFASAGTTYQAISSIGFSPGDTVLVYGKLGPGALPMQVLQAMGCHAKWITTQTHTHFPENLNRSILEKTPNIDELSAARIHIMDFSPSQASVACWQPVARVCLSCSFMGPIPHLPSELNLEELLSGQAVLRWVHNLHPHLALELAAMAINQRVTIRPWICTYDLSKLKEVFLTFCADFHREQAEYWPVLLNQRTG